MVRFHIGGTQPEDLSPAREPDDPPTGTPTPSDIPPAQAEPEIGGYGAGTSLDQGGEVEVPEDGGYRPGEGSTPVPPKQLSPSAVDKRLRRIMTPTSSGALKVPQELIDQWKDLSTRGNVMSMFEKAGYDPDWVGGKWNQNKSESG